MLIFLAETISLSYFLILANIGCARASSMVILKYGLNYSILFRRSIDSLSAPGYFRERSILSVLGKASKYYAAFVSVTKVLSSLLGVPIT